MHGVIFLMNEWFVEHNRENFSCTRTDLGGICWAMKWMKTLCLVLGEQWEDLTNACRLPAQTPKASSQPYEGGELGSCRDTRTRPIRFGPISRPIAVGSVGGWCMIANLRGERGVLASPKPQQIAVLSPEMVGMHCTAAVLGTIQTLQMTAGCMSVLFLFCGSRLFGRSMPDGE